MGLEFKEGVNESATCRVKFNKAVANKPEHKAPVFTVVGAYSFVSSRIVGADTPIVT